MNPGPFHLTSPPSDCAILYHLFHPLSRVNFPGEQIINPSASNPVATIQDVDNRVDPVKDEVESARGDRSSLDSRLDVMLKNDGTFKGITSINPQPPLSGGGTSGTVQIGISPATPSEPGSMSAADKTKLNGIEAGATADMTAEEIVNLIRSSALLNLVDLGDVSAEEAAAFSAAGFAGASGTNRFVVLSDLDKITAVYA